MIASFKDWKKLNEKDEDEFDKISFNPDNTEDDSDMLDLFDVEQETFHTKCEKVIARLRESFGHNVQHFKGSQHLPHHFQFSLRYQLSTRYAFSLRDNKDGTVALYATVNIERSPRIGDGEFITGDIRKSGLDFSLKYTGEIRTGKDLYDAIRIQPKLKYLEAGPTIEIENLPDVWEFNHWKTLVDPRKHVKENIEDTTFGKGMSDEDYQLFNDLEIEHDSFETKVKTVIDAIEKDKGNIHHFYGGDTYGFGDNATYQITANFKGKDGVFNRTIYVIRDSGQGTADVESKMTMELDGTEFAVTLKNTAPIETGTDLFKLLTVEPEFEYDQDNNKLTVISPENTWEVVRKSFTMKKYNLKKKK